MKLRKNQFYCLACNKARIPKSHTNHTKRMKGRTLHYMKAKCPTCSNKMARIVKAPKKKK